MEALKPARDTRAIVTGSIVALMAFVLGALALWVIARAFAS